MDFSPLARRATAGVEDHPRVTLGVTVVVLDRGDTTEGRGEVGVGRVEATGAEEEGRSVEEAEGLRRTGLFSPG